MTVTISKDVYLDENICYVLDKCCSIIGYAARLGYVDINKNSVKQIIYKKKIPLNSFYLEIQVEIDSKLNLLKEKCSILFSLYSKTGDLLKEFTSDYNFIGSHIIDFENKHYIINIMCQ